MALNRAVALTTSCLAQVEVSRSKTLQAGYHAYEKDGVGAAVSCFIARTLYSSSERPSAMSETISAGGKRSNVADKDQWGRPALPGRTGTTARI